MNPEKQHFFQKLITQLKQSDIIATFIRKAGIAFILQVIGTGLGYGLQVFLARTMGASEYGLYNYIMAWAVIAAIAATLGLSGAVLRFIPEYITQGDQRRLLGVVRSSQWITLGSSLAISLGGIVIVLGWNAYQPIQALTPILLGILTIPLLTLEDLQLCILRAAQQIGSAYAPNKVMRPLLLIGGGMLVFFWQGSQPLSSTAAFGVTILTVLMVLILQHLLIQNKVLGTSHQEQPIYQIRGWLRVSLPLLMITGFVTILYQTDLLMIGALLGPKEVGLYTPALKTANLASFIFTAVATIAAPMIASLYAADNRKDLQKLVSTMAHVSFWPSLVITLLLIGCSQPILGAFGPEFLATRWVLAILALGQLFNAMTGPVGYLIDLTGHHDQSLKIRFYCALINVGLNVIGISLFGIMGAALATAITISLDNLIMYVLAVKYIGIHASIFSSLTLRQSQKL